VADTEANVTTAAGADEADAAAEDTVIRAASGGLPKAADATRPAGVTAGADATAKDTVRGAASGGLPRAANEADAGAAASTAAEAGIDAAGSDTEAWLPEAAVPNRLLTRAAVAS